MKFVDLYLYNSENKQPLFENRERQPSSAILSSVNATYSHTELTDTIVLWSGYARCVVYSLKKIRSTFQKYSWNLIFLKAPPEIK